MKYIALLVVLLSCGIKDTNLVIQNSIHPNCQEGTRLGVWLDDDNDGVEDSFKGSFVAYQGDISAVDNYNYFSFSAHPIFGPKPKGFQSTVFFYQGNEGLTLFFFHNIDEGGSEENRVRWDITTSDNDFKDKVIFSDDKRELTLEAKTSKEQLYHGRFKYWENTDGGVIGPFVGEDFRIHIENVGDGDIKQAQFYSSDTTTMDLLDSKKDLNSFIIKYHSYEDCI